MHTLVAIFHKQWITVKLLQDLWNHNPKVSVAILLHKVEEEWEVFNLKLDFLKLGMALHQLQEARGVVSHNWICLKKQPYHQLLLLRLGVEATQRRLLIKQLMLHMRLPKEFCHRYVRIIHFLKDVGDDAV